MPGARLQQRPAPRSSGIGGRAAVGAAWHPEGPRPRSRLRLAWSADRAAGQPARASGPTQVFAPHRGAACRLFSPAPSPTSSAPRLRGRWVLEFEPTRRQEPDRLIGWVGGGDPLSLLRLEFPSKEAALAYVGRHGLACEVSEPRRRRAAPRSYAENFLAPPEPVPSR
jgi:ETC complex I subunit conserved region